MSQTTRMLLMLQNKFEMPLDLRVKPSKLLYFYLMALFVLSFFAIFLTSLSFILKLILVVSIFVFAVHEIKKRQNHHISSLILSNTEEWKIEINNQRIRSAELSGECIVTYFIIWLNFVTYTRFGRKKVYRLLLLPDSADRDVLRQFRVRLRFLKMATQENLEKLD